MTESVKPNESSRILLKGVGPDEFVRENELKTSSTPTPETDLLAKTESTASLEEGFEPNCYLGLGVDPIALDEKLHKIINGTGDQIDQLYLYLSPTSAAAFKRETTMEAYKSGNNIPVEEIVGGIERRIQKTLQGHAQLNIIALGSGQARQEQRLIQTMLRRHSVQKTNLFLIDSSHPMLNAGFLECEEVFASYRHEVKSWAVYQDFRELPHNKRLLRLLSQPNQVNLITLLGGTFANIENESLFLRNTLRAFPSKTLLLMDIITPWKSSEDPEEIRKNDPFLRGKTPWAKLAESRWAIPFIQHHPKVKTPEDIEFTRILDMRACIVKKSYAIEVKARIDNDEWTIQRFKCYDLRSLTEEFRHDGWSHINTFSFFDERRLVLLFQKD